MLNTILILAVVLILAILLVIFRITTLVSVVRGEASQRIPSSNKTQAILLVLFLVFGIIGFFYFSFGGLDAAYTQPLASEHGEITDRLFWITMGITCFVFILTHILLFSFSYIYRHDEKRRASFYPHNNTLEIIWTAVPAVVLAVLVLSGWRAWTDITGKAPDNSEIVEIMAYQYAWAVRYPGTDKQLGNYDYQKIDATNQMGIDFNDKNSFDDFVPREIHIPKGLPVLFKIRARDVIHSVYAPHFRMQMNAVPGMPTRFWFVPTKTTSEMRTETGNQEFNFELVCNKICGKGHFAMKYIIVVDEPAEYEKWYASQDPWLKQNADYLSLVPEHLKESASIAANIQNQK